MEGKGLLLKTFADIDVFDIEVDTEDQSHSYKLWSIFQRHLAESI
ncbi:MAG: hypothetical protein CM15mP8_0480 [Methanobacteriota archaeon]|nr:MAG: hypothetical protein CM15mP8_0480 [Euryarchaeota archaeon]